MFLATGRATLPGDEFLAHKVYRGDDGRIVRCHEIRSCRCSVPALQPWADQFGDGATAIRRTDGDADRGGGAVGVAVIDRAAGVALVDGRQEPHFCS